MKHFFCFTISDKVADCSTTDDTITTKTTSSSDKKFTWHELNKRSKNFSTQIGSGGFSTVYLARLPDTGLTALKVQPTCTDRLARIHDQELQILTRIKHPNIVRLLGHSDDRDDERILVFEYASNGTLHDCLHQSNCRKVLKLTWETRILIAFRLAEALEYLHGMQIIHGDIKASNILLDEEMSCKLCDFGSAKVGFTSMVLPPSTTKMNRMIMGSQGYVDPCYLKNGLVSKRNDVYSFGVVVLELVTGREAFSMQKGEKLTEVMGPVMNGLVGVEEVVDPRLRCGGGLDLEEAKAMVMLARKCIDGSPMVRPCASEIVAFMRDKFPSISHL